MATMSAVAGFAPVASSPRAFHRRAGRRPNLPHAAAASREPPSSPPDGKSTTDPEKSNNVVGRESSAATLAVEEVRAWCLRTDGGVLATEADVAALRAAVDRLRDVTDDRTPHLAGTRWRLAGCAQHTLRSPATWLASPFFWIAKEAQHESARLARVPDLFPPWRLAAELSAGGRSGEEWIVAFGARQTGAPFPFSLGEAILNGLAVPFRSDAATVEFRAPGARESDEGARGTGGTYAPRRSLRMTSRIEVAFGVGRFRVAGDLVTEARLLHAVGRRQDQSSSGSIDDGRGAAGGVDAETDADATDARAGSMLDREEEAEAARRRRRGSRRRPRLAVDVDVGAFVNWRTGGTPVKTLATSEASGGDVDGDVDAGGDAVGRRLDADAADFASWRVGGVATTGARRAPPPASTSPEPREEIVGMETREEIETRRACLLTTRFERTGTPLDGVDVASGRIMGALMSPSPRLRRSFREGALPSVPYAHVWCDGETMIAEAGSCAETSTLLVYARVPWQEGGCAFRTGDV